MEKKFKSLFKVHGQQNSANTSSSEISQFYLACRNGDIETVKKILPTIPYDHLNELEPNGSTPLHAATYYGHLEIVRLLLHDHTCPRNRTNRYDLTAYEEAQTEEMRQLFHRPSHTNRFSDGSHDIQSILEIVSSPHEKVQMEESDGGTDEIVPPNQQCLAGYQTNEEIKTQMDGLNGVKALLQSRLGRHLMKQAMKHTVGKDDCSYDDEEYAYVANKLFGIDALRKLLNEHITIDHPEYRHAAQLVDDYIQHGRIESLLTLYSMETPFYHRLLIRINPLAFPLFMHLPDLKQRYYQGKSYRGVRMTRDELGEYCWALKNKDSFISTTKFASTSIDRHIAEQFATVSSSSSSSSEKISVLLIFHFPQSCDTAINLGKIPEHNLPCISNFENEHEVLVTPRTFFKVKRIETNPSNGQRVIDLENICGEHQTIFGTLMFFLKQDLKRRFHC